jgi:predicted HNH restriction endonuclease
MRLPGPSTAKTWLTLFLVHDSGELTVWYTRLWKHNGVPAAVATQYESQLKRLFGEDILDRGVSVTSVVAKWGEFTRTATKAAAAVQRYAVGMDSASSRPSDQQIVAAIEGLVIEARAYKKSRNRPLRDEALAQARGRCACCSIVYGKLLGGRGRRVLQVHHRDQLAQRIVPRVSTVADLAVVCANCHALIHADPKAALTVEAVKSLWKRSRYPALAT